MDISEEEIAEVIKCIIHRPPGYDPLVSVPNYIARDEDGWWAVFSERPKLRLGSFYPNKGDTKILIAYLKTYDKPCCIPLIPVNKE